jgi:hypothetical protein
MVGMQTAQPTRRSPAMTDGISTLAQAVMRGVAASGCVVSDRGARDNTQRAVDIMRDELKAFINGARYADARDCVLRGSLPDRTIVALIIANCVSRITRP